MADQEKREKVIKGLECHVNGDPQSRCHKCPYWGTGIHGLSECSVMAADALELLKAQEPNDDWISRKRLRDEIQYYIDEAGWGDEANKVLSWCLEFIDNQEAVRWNG